MINEAFINYLKHHPRGLILKDIKCLGTLKLILLFLKKKDLIELIYRGEILNPSIKDCDELIISRSKELRKGDFVLFIDDEGYPDIMRFLKAKDGHFILAADAIAFKKMIVKKDSIIGIVKFICRNEKQIRVQKLFCKPLFFPLYTFFNSIIRETKEIFKRPLFTNEKQAVKSVGTKYDIESQQYLGKAYDEYEALYKNFVKKYIEADANVLVVGSGTGFEAVALSKMGYNILGIDISPKMIEISKKKAKEEGLDIEFKLMDATHLTILNNDYSAVVFTPAVYSFIPKRKLRIKMLKDMRNILKPGGKVLFSIKGYRSGWKFIKVNISNVLFKLLSFFKKHANIEFGDWHTKFLDQTGELHFSYTKYFRKSEIKREIKKARYNILDKTQTFWVIQKV